MLSGLGRQYQSESEIIGIWIHTRLYLGCNWELSPSAGVWENKFVNNDNFESIRLDQVICCWYQTYVSVQLEQNWAWIKDEP